jgi:uncharacterized protein (TIGR04255 family)
VLAETLFPSDNGVMSRDRKAPPTHVDLEQDFETLKHDPIAEAMITFVGRAKTEWTPHTTGRRIAEALSDYPSGQHMNFARFSFAMNPQGEPAKSAEPPSSTATAENLGWAGLRLTSTDGRQIVSVARDNLSFSRLAPYPGWTKVSGEMRRLWRIHRDIAGVDSIERIEIRYVNRLEVPSQDFDPAAFFHGFGEAPEGMARGPFLHQDTLHHVALPRCVLNLIRTFEIPAPMSNTVPLIVVLEAVHAEPIPADDATIDGRLAEMHWLKNHAFFQSVTPDFLDLCR